MNKNIIQLIMVFVILCIFVLVASIDVSLEKEVNTQKNIQGTTAPIPTPTPQQQSYVEVEVTYDDLNTSYALELARINNNLIVKTNNLKTAKDELKFAKNVFKMNEFYNSRRRNKFFTEKAILTFEDYLKLSGNVNIDALVVSTAMTERQHLLSKYKQWADYYYNQASQEKKWNKEKEHKEYMSKYFISQNNFDYFASKYYLDPIVANYELDFAKKDAIEELASLDAITYGIFLESKINRIDEGISLNGVNNILGPGRLIGEVKIGDETLKKYSWTCKAGLGYMEIIFDDNGLYSKRVQWNLE